MFFFYTHVAFSDFLKVDLKSLLAEVSSVNYDGPIKAFALTAVVFPRTNKLCNHFVFQLIIANRSCYDMSFQQGYFAW